MKSEQPEALRAQIGQGVPDDAAAKERDRILSALKRHDWHSSNIWRYYYPSSTGDWVDLRELRKLLASAPPAPHPAFAFRECEDSQAGIEPQNSVVQQEPTAWKHDCAVLLANDVELWIDACPHCGKPRHHQAQQQPLTDEQIEAIYTQETGSLIDDSPWALVDFVRAIEAAHNIGEKK